MVTGTTAEEFDAYGTLLESSGYVQQDAWKLDARDGGENLFAIYHDDRGTHRVYTYFFPGYSETRIIVDTEPNTVAGFEYVSDTGETAVPLLCQYGLSFSVAADNAVSSADAETVLRNIATGQNYFYAANTEESLTNALHAIITTASHAATRGWFQDTMGDDYDLFTKRTVINENGREIEVNVNPTIRVMEYQLDENGNRTGKANVLDHSGSMRTPVGAPGILQSGTLYTGGGEIPRSQISTEKARHRGYYVAQSAQVNENGEQPTYRWFIMEYVENYEQSGNARWVGYSVPETQSIETIEMNHSYTCPSAGLHMASDLFAANAVNMTERDRIVVLFTDGIPNRQIGEDEGVNVDDAKQKAIYDEIVKQAYETKNTNGAQVYSICTTTLEAGENGENRTFLNYASSNYPNADGYSTPGATASDEYFHTIGDFASLRNVFETITQSTASVELDGTAVLRDIRRMSMKKRNNRNKYLWLLIPAAAALLLAAVLLLPDAPEQSGIVGTEPTPARLDGCARRLSPAEAAQCTVQWDLLPQAQDEAELLRAVLAEYEVAEQEAAADIAAFLEKLRSLEIL